MTRVHTGTFGFFSSMALQMPICRLLPSTIIQHLSIIFRRAISFWSSSFKKSSTSSLVVGLSISDRGSGYGPRTTFGFGYGNAPILSWPLFWGSGQGHSVTGVGHSVTTTSVCPVFSHPQFLIDCCTVSSSRGTRHMRPPSPISRPCVSKV